MLREVLGENEGEVAVKSSLLKLLSSVYEGELWNLKSLGGWKAPSIVD
jgi:hypothetical protein